MYKRQELLIRKSNWSSAHIISADCPTLQLPVTKVFIIETVTQNCKTNSWCRNIVLDIQKSDMLLWNYIQYNFVIAGDGSIFEAQSWNYTTCHYKGIDTKSLLVAMTGNTYGGQTRGVDQVTTQWAVCFSESLSRCQRYKSLLVTVLSAASFMLSDFRQ